MVLEPIGLWLSRRLFIESYDVEAGAKVTDDVVRAISWPNHLRSDQNYVEKVTQEKEPQGGEFQDSKGWVTKVKPAKKWQFEQGSVVLNQS